MYISIDRQDGTFTPQAADRINIKSSNLWNQIQSMNVPVIANKEVVELEQISPLTSGVTMTNDNSFHVGKIHYINAQFTTSLGQPYYVEDEDGNRIWYPPKFTKIADVRTPPSERVYVSLNDGEGNTWFYKIDAGSSELCLANYSTSNTYVPCFLYYIT